MVFTTEKQNENTQNPFFKSFHLTDLEIDVLACLHNGATTKKMALILNLKVTTARTHTYKMMQKLDKHTKESAVEYAKKEGQSDYLTVRAEALIKHYEVNKLRLTLAKQVGSQKKICHIVCDKPVLFEELRQDLRCFGIKVVTKHVQTSAVSMTILTMPSKIAVSNVKAMNGCLIYYGDYYDLFWDVLEEVVIHPAIEEARLFFEELLRKIQILIP